jgi:hypothetical protein
MAKVGGDDLARPAHVGIALIRSLSLRISSPSNLQELLRSLRHCPLHAVLVTISAVVVAVAAATAAAVGVVEAAVVAVAAGPVLV